MQWESTSFEKWKRYLDKVTQTRCRDLSATYKKWKWGRNCLTEKQDRAIYISDVTFHVQRNRKKREIILQNRPITRSAVKKNSQTNYKRKKKKKKARCKMKQPIWPGKCQGRGRAGRLHGAPSPARRWRHHLPLRPNGADDRRKIRPGSSGGIKIQRRFAVPSRKGAFTAALFQHPRSGNLYFAFSIFHY